MFHFHPLFHPLLPSDAVTCLQRAIKIHAASGSHCKVAKSERQVAEIYEGIYQQSGDCLDLESVLLHYQQAEALYKARGPQYLTYATNSNALFPPLIFYVETLKALLLKWGCDISYINVRYRKASMKI